MKEYPDYKYRPRRKPKSMVKSPSSVRQNIDSNAHLSRSQSIQHSNQNETRNFINKLDHNQQLSASHNHSHVLRSSSPSLVNNHHNSQQAKYLAPIDFPISFSQQQHCFPYPTLVDPTLALDLQARLQAMYAGVYYPWRFGCSPPLAIVTSPKISPTTAANSPTPDLDTTII